MNSGATAERVYDAVKRRILTGVFQPGERIEVAALAQVLDSSATPVRDALHLLVGERLVETRTGDGFHLPSIDAPALNDLYDWNAQVLLQALRNWSGALDSMPGEREVLMDNNDPGVVTGAVFGGFAARTGNAEYRREIRSNNDRLHAVRIAETAVLSDWRDEIDGIRSQSADENVRILRRLIVTYHRRRQRLITEILRALHQLEPRS